MTGHYGEAPVDLGPIALPQWQEFMHYLYLPAHIPEGHYEVRSTVMLPQRLEFLSDAVWRAMSDAYDLDPRRFHDPYVYVTARRGFATPGNPLNRPGWHCDDFGGADLNYIWSDRYPTRILRSTYPLPISDDDEKSMLDMASYEERQDRTGVNGMTTRAGRWWIEDAPVGHLLRLTPHVVHDTPTIPEPGGMRSFFKISVSTHRYNLLGNSHNHLLDYDWPMYDRAAVRNQPGGNGDYFEPEEPS